MNGAALAVEIALAASSAPALACTGYLFVLTLAAGRRPPPAPPPAEMRFDFVVPAHDEEAGIAKTVASLRAVDYPADRFRVLVIADNCSDATAARARDAGATVIERVDTTRRGKGYALEAAFERSLADGLAQAVVVVDADSAITPNLLRAFSARFAAGANAVQAEYGVSNPNASWRTRLMVIALSLFHVLRSLGRERLSVSCGLRGNGMGFSAALLRQVPHDAFSVVEDLEYGIRIGRAGHRVWFVPEARVLGEMVSGESASRSQRTRWEAGRFSMAKQHAIPLLGRAIADRSALLFDLAMDVIVPPLTYLFAIVLVGAAAAGASLAWNATHATGVTPFAWVPWGAALFFVAAYVLRGVALSGTGLRGVRDLAWAPVYMVWKLALAVKQRRARKDAWVRTAREKLP